MALVPTNDTAAPITPQNDLLAALTQSLGDLPTEPTPTPEPAPTATSEPAPTATPTPEPEVTVDPNNPLAALEAQKPEATKLPIDDLNPESGEKIKPEDKAGYRIKELKEEINTKWKPLEQTLAQKEAEIKELAAKAAQIDELKQKLEAQEQEMSVVKLERTEAYQTQVAKPMQSLIESAVKLADRHSIDKDELLDALEIEDYETAKAKIVALTTGLDIPAIDVLEMVGLHGKVQPVLAKRNELYANADKALSELQVRAEQEQIQKRAQIAEERVRTAPVILDLISNKIPELADFVKTHGEAIAKTDIDSLDLSNRIYNHAAGLAVPVLAQQNRTLKQQLDDALDEIGKLKKAAPNPAGQRYSATPTEKPTDLLQVLNRELGFA